MPKYESVGDGVSRYTREGVWAYRKQYVDHNGNRPWVYGKTKAEVLRKIEAARALTRDAKAGLPVRFRIKEISFDDATAEYLAWGASVGRRRKRGGWCPEHNDHRKFHLEWWKDKLPLHNVSDLNGSLPKVEAGMQALEKAGLSNNTRYHYGAALKAFANWAVEHEYLAENPVKRLYLPPKETKKENIRRVFTPEEYAALRAVAAPHRMLTYDVASATGLRKGELKALTVADVDFTNGGLRLRAEWTKNRKAAFQPLAPAVMEALRKAVEGKAPTDSLLFVPRHAGTALGKDLKAAGIPKVTAEGKLDFHAFRNTFITRVVESGATIKETMELARHADPKTTMRVYARAGASRLTEIAAKVDPNTSPKPGPSAPRVHHATGTRAAKAVAVKVSGNRGEVPSPPPNHRQLILLRHLSCSL